MAAGPQQLYLQARALCGDAYFREVVWHHCPHLESTDPSALSLAIHPDDQMLWHSLRHHRDANVAFSQYYNVALQQYSAAQQVLRLLFPGTVDRVRVLDFACGYGRLLRFLSLSLPTANLWASEIQPQALAFVRDTFNVNAIASEADPQAFQPDRRFQLIWVASLFSHLPDRLFEAWLRRLTDCLTPDGVLCFSTHDACLIPDGAALPAEGILCRPFSENPALDTSDYGTTYVSEDYVSRLVSKACGADRGYSRIPRGLAHEQDLYLVPATPDRDLSVLRSFRHGPWGWVDERILRPSGELYLRGWAASLDDGPLDAVDITIDGQAFRCPTGLPRDDVGRVFNDPRLNRSGWEFRQMTADVPEAVRVVVTARTRRNERALLYTGRLPRPAVAAGQGHEASTVAQLPGSRHKVMADRFPSRAGKTPMKTLYLHVGPHKTATTFLQKFMLDNATELSQSNLVYPRRMFRIFGHHPFRDALADRAIAPQDIAYLRDAGHDLLLSSEDLISLEGFQFSYLRDLLPDTRIIAVYAWRRAGFRLYSIWQETIKHGGTSTFFDYYHHHLAYPANSMMLSPDLKLGMLSRVFGKANVRVLDYDASTRHGSLVSDFLAALDRPWREDYMVPSDDPLAANPSMDFADTEVIRALNHIFAQRFDTHGASVRVGYFEHLAGLEQAGLEELKALIRNYHLVLDVGNYQIDVRAEQIMANTFKDNMLNYEPNTSVKQVTIARPDWVLDLAAQRLLNTLAQTLKDAIA